MDLVDVMQETNKKELCNFGQRRQAAAKANSFGRHQQNYWQAARYERVKIHQQVQSVGSGQHIPAHRCELSSGLKQEPASFMNLLTPTEDHKKHIPEVHILSSTMEDCFARTDRGMRRRLAVQLELMPSFAGNQLAARNLS